MKNLFSAGVLPAMAAAVLMVGGSQAATSNAAMTQQPQIDIDTIDTMIEELADEDKALPQLVAEYKNGDPLDREGKCLATAVYFEARGESVEGQLAVADVVLNRADSDKYPDDWCQVVKQKAQFSFVENGKFPKIRDAKSWETAKAVARIAIDGADNIVRGDVLWYHANYVKPIWRHNLNKVHQEGVHIFYNA